LGLGSAYLNTLQYLLAIDNYQKALNIQEEIFPPLHPSLAYCHSKLALAFFHNHQNDSSIKHFELALEIGLKSLPSGHPQLIDLCYVLGYIHKDMGNIARSEEYFGKQFDLLNLPRTSVTSMVEVVELSHHKMHYICPRCRLPVWVYSTCRNFKGKPCARCLRQILHFQRQVRVSPA
jgi:tetratricopeptide (TPR) repeat protein